TKCCSEVCPEHIKITDNAIIPLKERVADAYYDPLQWAWRKLRGRDDGTGAGTELPVLPGRPATDGDTAGAGGSAVASAGDATVRGAAPVPGPAPEPPHWPDQPD